MATVRGTRIHGVDSAARRSAVVSSSESTAWRVTCRRQRSRSSRCGARLATLRRHAQARAVEPRPLLHDRVRAAELPGRFPAVWRHHYFARRGGHYRHPRARRQPVAWPTRPGTTAALAAVPLERPGTGLSFIYIGVAITTVVLTAGAIWNYVVLAAVALPPRNAAAMLKVVGHQWWWEVKYSGPSASQSFTTANEIHIPVGKPVRIELTTADVIHSFWVPALTGKTDTIPGQRNVTWMQADSQASIADNARNIAGSSTPKWVFSSSPSRRTHSNRGGRINYKVRRRLRDETGMRAAETRPSGFHAALRGLPHCAGHAGARQGRS